jgi:hypothetical protein
LLQALARGEEVTGDEELDADIIKARRQVMMTLRKIQKETEKMMNRFAANPGAGTARRASGREGKEAEAVKQGPGSDVAYTGIQAVWDAFASIDPTERKSITAVQAAQVLLGPQTDGSLPVVRPNTLPAYAAHELLMANPQYFLSGDRNQWESCSFMVRSRDEVERNRRVEAVISRSTAETSAQFDDFVRKVRAALAARSRSERHTTEWTVIERELLHALAMRLYESRSTQLNPNVRIATVILRTIDPYPGEAINEQLIARVLQDIGVVPQCDTLTTSKVIENVCRALSMQGVKTTETGLPLRSPSASASTSLAPSRMSGGGGDRNGLLRGDELDGLRTDFSSHRVWVIDDASALELDDGISFTRIEGSDDIRVHVHVADPTSVIPLDHDIARRAGILGTASYLPEGNTPLFPLPDIMSRFSLGAGIATKRSGQGVLTISARVSPQGTFSEPCVELGWIENSRLTTYDAVDEALGSSSAQTRRMPFGIPELALQKADEQIDETKARVRAAKQVPISEAERSDVDLLFQIARIRRRHRLRNAGFDHLNDSSDSTLFSAGPIRPLSNLFASPSAVPSSTAVPGAQEDIHVKYSVHSNKPREASSASAVSEIMMLAGRVCAEWCSQRGIAIPYRGGLEPIEVVASSTHRGTMSLAEVLAQRDENGLIDKMVLRRSGLGLAPGFVDSKPVDHWQMGFVGDDKGYTRASSPLRRFDDFLVHAQIKSWLARHSATASTPSWGRLLDTEQVMSLVAVSDDAQRRDRLNGRVVQAYWRSHLVMSRLADYSAQGYIPDDSGALVNLDAPFKGLVTVPPTPIPGSIGSTGPMQVEVPELQCAMTVDVGKESGRFEIGQEVRVRVVEATLRPKADIRAVLL